MPFDLKPDEKVPTGKSIRDIVGSIRETSKTRPSTPPRIKTPMTQFKIKSLSSKNQVVVIGSSHVNFDGNGEALMDEHFRQEAEHHCNLRQGFFHIIDVHLPNKVEAFLESTAGEKVTLGGTLEFSDLAQITANFLAAATEEEKLTLVGLTDVKEIEALLASVADREDANSGRINGNDLEVVLPQRVFVPSESEDTNTSEDDYDPAELLAAVESGEMKIDENGEVTKVEKRGRGRPPKTSK